MPSKWVKVHVVFKQLHGHRADEVVIHTAHLRLNGYMYRTGRYYRITGMGWEGDRFFVHISPIWAHVEDGYLV